MLLFWSCHEDSAVYTRESDSWPGDTSHCPTTNHVTSRDPRPVNHSQRSGSVTTVCKHPLWLPFRHNRVDWNPLQLASDDTGSNSAGQLPVQALTTPECEKQIREVLSSQIPIINYTSVKSQRFKCCSMWCWRIKQMQGEKTGARVIQKKIYIPRDTEDRATNRQRWPVFCIHRAHSCKFLPRNIDRQC